jgi:hypothetical protein
MALPSGVVLATRRIAASGPRRRAPPRVDVWSVTRGQSALNVGCGAQGSRTAGLESAPAQARGDRRRTYEAGHRRSGPAAPESPPAADVRPPAMARRVLRDILLGRGQRTLRDTSNDFTRIVALAQAGQTGETGAPLRRRWPARPSRLAPTRTSAQGRWLGSARPALGRTLRPSAGPGSVRRGFVRAACETAHAPTVRSLHSAQRAQGPAHRDRS